jgi:hypothetical protein
MKTSNKIKDPLKNRLLMPALMSLIRDVRNIHPAMMGSARLVLDSRKSVRMMWIDAETGVPQIRRYLLWGPLAREVRIEPPVEAPVTETPTPETPVPTPTPEEPTPA